MNAEMFNYVYVSNAVLFRNYGIKNVHTFYIFPISYFIILNVHRENSIKIKIVFNIKNIRIKI